MEQQDKNQIAGVVLPFLVVIVLLLVAGLTPGGAATTMDSLYYLEAAESIAQGHGVSYQSFDLTDDKYEPITMWPPLYPIVLAPFTFVADTAEAAAGYFNVISLVLALVVFVLIAKRLMGLAPAGVFALFLAMQPPVLTIYTYAWSETLFFPLILFTYFCGLKYMEATRGGDGKTANRWLLLSAILLGLAANTRYIGLAFFPGIVFMIWLASNGALKKFVVHSIGVGVVTFVSLLPLFVRNYLHSGYLSGAERGTPATHYLQDTINLLKVLALNFFNFHFLVSIVVVLALVAMVGYAAVQAKRQKAAWSSLPTDVLLPLSWALVYFAALIVLRGVQNIDLDTRMASVAVPFILLAAAGLAKQLSAFVPAPVALAPFMLWAGFQTFQGYATYDNVIKAWRTGQPLVLATKTVAHVNLRTNQFTLIAKSLYAEMHKTRGDFIVFNEWRPMFFRRLVGVKVKQVPLPLNADTVRRINSVGGKTGVFWISSKEGIDALNRAYGADVSRLRLVQEAAAMGITIVELPLPLPTVKPSN